MIDLETKRQRQREADARFRLRHPEKQKEKHHRRYEENKEQEKARNQSYYMLNRDVQRIRHRNNRHKITSDWYDAKLAKQENRCAICGSPFVKTPHIDHRHACCPSARSCGKCNRGLLCDDCNLGLGRFKDNPAVLRKAAEYVEAY
jgi:hypothetical protein